jgi:hypothetical protein
MFINKKYNMINSVEIKNNTVWWEYTIDSDGIVSISWILWNTSWISEANKVFPITQINSDLNIQLEEKKIDWYQVIWEVNAEWNLNQELTNFLQSDIIEDYEIIQNIVICKIKSNDWNNKSTNIQSNTSGLIKDIFKNKN